ncbi:CPBP family intramembrane metalloprotease [Agreia pratensis]|uniref:CPBP family intramembrane glutamic endopeptidase n=1 Tax=Agreia pratensis TaxID=150121 RepID=UPI00188B0DB6|nr:CPBP family intramembrane glutamic endopeptidase [Agreia pratensis]MBF4633032.1 CPBP family intramembrane metalloprotease [Agreia pratensis]
MAPWGETLASVGYGVDVSRPQRSPTSQTWGFYESWGGYIATALSLWFFIQWLRGATLFDPHLVLVASYGVVWLPLIVAIVIASVRGGHTKPRTRLGLRITWLDVFLGLGAGLLLRAVAGLIETALTGRMIGLGVTFGDPVYDGWWLFGTVLAPVLIAPIIEETFFRGLLQRSTSRFLSLRTGRRTSAGLAIALSASTFTLLHLMEAANPTAAVILGISTFILGLAAATLTASTGRIGAALVTHIVFNATLVLPSLLLL